MRHVETKMKKDERCPHCGYCPHCGRSDGPVKTFPYPVPMPYPHPYPVYPRQPRSPYPYGSTWSPPSRAAMTCGATALGAGFSSSAVMH